MARKRVNKLSKAHQSPFGEVRIIGGDFRGRKLPVLNGEGLRPTSDRVRETLFNWLQFEVPNADCLDVFSGSGALGFEALSRGAKSVTFLEKSAAVAQQLKHNIQTLKLTHANVQCVDSLTFLQTELEHKFDLVFIDPPFNQGLIQPTIDLIFEQKWLKNHQAWLYLEQEKQLDWPTLPDGWVCHREKSTAQVKFAVFKYATEEH